MGPSYTVPSAPSIRRSKVRQTGEVQTALVPSTNAPFSQYAFPEGLGFTMDVTAVVEVTSVVAVGAVETDVTVATVDVLVT